MTGGEELVGPFPAGVDPEEYDRARRRLLWSMPSGLYVLGSRAGGRRNLMTLNWATQVATNPKLLAVSVEVRAYTHRLLREGRVFALNLIS
ncbi:MAG: flavin reductase family protein, partial [Acidimicrobiales bacterium]